MKRAKLNSPVVWIVKEQMLRGETSSVAMDYSPALQYGQLEFITVHDLPMYNGSAVTEQWRRDVREFCENYDPVIDYVVPTGQPTAILAVGYALGRYNKAPRFLVWRREENRYRIVNFDMIHQPVLV